MKTDHVTPECSCPGCGHLFDRATGTGEGTEAPQVGDVSLCIECAVMLEYTETAVTLLADEKYAAFDTETRFQLQRAKQAIEAIHRLEK